MANAATLAAARKHTRGIAARTRAQAVSKLQLASLSDDTPPLDFPDSDTPMASASEDQLLEEPGQALLRRPAVKQKAAMSDVSDNDTPAPQPRKKAQTEAQAKAKAKAQKPKRPPKKLKKTAASDSDDTIEVVATEPDPIGSHLRDHRLGCPLESGPEEFQSSLFLVHLNKYFSKPPKGLECANSISAPLAERKVRHRPTKCGKQDGYMPEVLYWHRLNSPAKNLARLDVI
ncbi:hypothetical protein C8F04DRAFT_1177882 [Mycena alexandri]|uniref:Uncharacterized protein n=1 Tax=Mycena alexandri TaxID=1745969 RepID=A0AAD6TAZ4_9AGAR|nr:hypothetical protein C8F04DRAFT_1177882 [Mycena alexandri]